MFVCFIDYDEAFDKVNYRQLFKQLIDDPVNGCVVSCILISRRLAMWLNSQSNSFCIGNDTKQVPFYLHTYRYIQLLLMISTSKIRCHIVSMAANIFTYADNVVLLAFSWHAMQKLIVLLLSVAMFLIWNVMLEKQNAW